MLTSMHTNLICFGVKADNFTLFWLGGECSDMAADGPLPGCRLFALFGSEGVNLHFLPFLPEPESYKCSRNFYNHI